MGQDAFHHGKVLFEQTSGVVEQSILCAQGLDMRRHFGVAVRGHVGKLQARINELEQALMDVRALPVTLSFAPYINRNDVNEIIDKTLDLKSNTINPTSPPIPRP